MVCIQETAQLHEVLKDLKDKWAELQDVVTVDKEHESTFMEKINNLEAILSFKIEETTDVE